MPASVAADRARLPAEPRPPAGAPPPAPPPFDPGKAPATGQAPDPGRRDSLLPPDPNAPTGPPPAFEASLLDRERELATVVARADAAADARRETALRETIRRVISETGPYDVPPSPAERAQEGVSTLRRIEAPYDTATVNIAR